MNKEKTIALACGLACLYGAAGCADEETLPARSPVDARDGVKVCVTAPNAEEQGTFWAAREATESIRPATPPRQSISLGYAGDEPLIGGVTRNDPTEPRAAANPYAPQRWEGYITTPTWRSEAPPPSSRDRRRYAGTEPSAAPVIDNR
ncbi:MAG: hypothetical protein JWM74_5559 [Myxococcaceae bacterium]|nr:hypothetical protein [Myxococcaceae bacterium]